MTDENQTNEQPDDTQQVTDLDMFVRLLVGWHGKRVRRLEEILQTPEGTEVTLDGGAPFVLSGEKLQAFRIGVALSLSQLGRLPFAAEFAAEPTDDKPVH